MSLSQFEKEMLDAHNEKRKKHLDTKPLEWSKELATKATKWAEHLAKDDELGYSGTDDGETVGK